MQFNSRIPLYISINQRSKEIPKTKQTNKKNENPPKRKMQDFIFSFSQAFSPTKQKRGFFFWFFLWQLIYFEDKKGTSTTDLNETNPDSKSQIPDSRRIN